MIFKCTRDDRECPPVDCPPNSRVEFLDAGSSEFGNEDVNFVEGLDRTQKLRLPEDEEGEDFGYVSLGFSRY